MNEIRRRFQSFKETWTTTADWNSSQSQKNPMKAWTIAKEGKVTRENWIACKWSVHDTSPRSRDPLSASPRRTTDQRTDWPGI